MKTFFVIFFLILVIFSLILCYGLGMWCMYNAGWYKSFYLSLITFIGLISLCLYVRKDIKANSSQ